MIDVTAVLKLHESTVSEWHHEPIKNDFSGIMELICQQHIFNYELWHQEDIAHSPNVTDADIAGVKRNIDRLNQARNDHIERIDDWLTTEIERQGITAGLQARLNTETPGSAIDRLSIMSLRLYHYREQLQREDVNEEHRALVAGRIDMCLEQRQDLSRSLAELLDDIRSGKRIHKTYRQMKMYNDPTLNPYLYNTQSVAAG